jgi:hypothetical protein
MGRELCEQGISTELFGACSLFKQISFGAPIGNGKQWCISSYSVSMYFEQCTPIDCVVEPDPAGFSYSFA